MLAFLGRKLHGKFAGEILNDWKRRWPGARVKHWMKGNWIPMYDKHGCVLRVETVINDPYEFTVRRRAGRRGRRTLGWHPLPKGVAFLAAYQRYQQLAIKQQLAQEQVMAAEMNEDAAMNWGAWGPFWY